MPFENGQLRFIAIRYSARMEDEQALMFVPRCGIASAQLSEQRP